MNTVLGPFDIAAALILLAAVFGYLNHRFLGLPRTIGLTVMGAVASVVVVVMDNVISGAGGSHAIRTFLEDIDFRFVLMEGMLSFLLFAGALHTDIHEMRRSKWSIGVITVVGVLLSTAIVGSGPGSWRRLSGAISRSPGACCSGRSSARPIPWRSSAY